MGIALPIIMGIIDGAFKLLANHLGKPAGWIPSPQEWTDLQSHVDAATPEAVKAEARARLIAAGFTLPPVEA
jgi:hypothetical protein